MNIRPEAMSDYAAIAAVHVEAFDGRAAEAVIVALHRHRAAYDPELSLLAEEGGRVVGHALFSPRSVRLLGAEVPAVNLAPIAVAAAAQRRGVGARLIAAGHEIAREKGYVLSFLLGHTSYYPRFGYRTGAFGSASLRVPAGPPLTGDLEARPPLASDLPALRELWRHEEAAVDFAVEPDVGLLGWLSPHPTISAEVWLCGGAIAGYTRVHAAEPDRPRVFLAADDAAARAIAGQLQRRAGNLELQLPLHPTSSSSATLGVARAEAWTAAMACPLAPSPFDPYYEQLQRRARPPGRVAWPAEFDLA